MGSTASKAAQNASRLSATNTARKYPTRSPPTSSNRTNTQPRRLAPEAGIGPTVHPDTKASENRSQAINLDSSDPDLALNDRLRTLGPVQPYPTQSNSSTFSRSSSSDPTMQTQFRPSASNPAQSIYPTSTPPGPNARQNPAISLLTARYRLAEEAEREFAEIGRKGAKGRQFLDVVTLRQVLVLRDEKGVGAGEIERRMGLKEGVVERLGRRGLVGVGS